MDRTARHQRLVAGFVTNVPGPVDALRLAGARVDSIHPVGVLAGNVRVGVAAVSYAGSLYCSVHFDAENLNGDAIASAMRRDLEALTALTH